jgi:hypothetical protein
MWENVAKFRFVDIEIPWIEMKETNPEVYLERLTQAAALLLKGWENEGTQPTALVRHEVTIHLGSLFNEIVPFNADPEPDPFGSEIYRWIVKCYPDLNMNYPRIAEASEVMLKKLVAIIAKNRGSTKWRFTALEELDDGKENGAQRLEDLKKSCAKAGLEFVGKPLGTCGDGLEGE